MSAYAVTPEPIRERLRIMTPAAAADRYLDELAREGKAASTRYRYKRYLYELADMYPYVDIEDLTPEMWRKWLDRICKGVGGKDLDRDTISQRVAIAKRFTDWLLDEGLTPVDALKRVKGPKRKNPVENDSIVWVSPEETRRMIAVARRDIELQQAPADKYRKILCLGVLAYTGSRRAAVSALRIKDYDSFSEPPMLTFVEKGDKKIKKPVNPILADLLREAHLAGVWNDTNDYLIPSVSTVRNPERDSRVIYSLVKAVAKDAKVEAHVHALRAAFAVIFLETKPDHIVALKDYLGHRNLETTLIYLRRLNRQKGMESVADLDWGESLGPTFHALPVTEKEGFEPSFEVSGLSKPDDCLGDAE